MNNTKILHFDTYYANYTNDPLNAATTNPNAFECQFTLPTALKNVTKVALKSVELPISFGQTRSATTSGCSGFYSVIVAGTTYNFTMSNYTYANIGQFLTDMNSVWTSVIGTPSGLGGVFSVRTEPGASSNQYFVILTMPAATHIQFVDGPLSTTMLGCASSGVFIVNSNEG